MSGGKAPTRWVLALMFVTRFGVTCIRIAILCFFVSWWRSETSNRLGPPDSFSFAGDSIGGPLQTLLEKADVEAGDEGALSMIFSGEQKHRSYRSVGSASSSGLTQSFMPVFRAPGFKHTEGSGQEDIWTGRHARQPPSPARVPAVRRGRKLGKEF